jgi:uncharacterized lipoprotein YddW (UPF0748 family)
MGLRAVRRRAPCPLSFGKETTMLSLTAHGLLRCCAAALALVLVMNFSAGCAATRTMRTDPKVEREVRGIFVTTAFNTDWPSRPFLDPLVAADEIDAIVDRAAELNCNAIFLQVRGFGDRIYRKKDPKFPDDEMRWTMYVSPAQRDPGYDPLQLWIDKAHAKGLELHAWVNPFRIDVPLKCKDFKVFDGGDGFLYIDPGSAAVQKYIVDVIEDLLKQYPPIGVESARQTDAAASAPIMASSATTVMMGTMDGLDGIIVDHYFPEPEDKQPPTTGPTTGPSGRVLEDAPPAGAPVFAAPAPAKKPPIIVSPKATGAATKARDSIVEKRRKAIWEAWKKTHNPPPLPGNTPLSEFFKSAAAVIRPTGARFGVSPNCGQETLVKEWLDHVDYVAPEIYVRKEKDFDDQLKKWRDELGEAKPIIPVLFTARVQTPPKNTCDRWDADDIEKQVKKLKNKHGHIHFSYHALRSREQAGPADNVGKKLKEKHYHTAPIPPSAGAPVQEKPHLSKAGGKIKFDMPSGSTMKVRRWIVQFRKEQQDDWAEQKVKGPDEKDVDVPDKTTELAVWAVDRNHRESLPATISWP